MTNLDAPKLRSVQHMYGLDLLRIFAATMVFLNHFATYSTSKPSITDSVSDRAFPFLSVFEGIGAVGVEVFFVISGFVISLSVAKLAGFEGAKRFLFSRALRIFPALWLSGSIAFVALLISGGAFSALVPAFLKYSVLSPIGPYIDGVVWSLVVEGFFYVLIGASVFVFSKAPLTMIGMVVGSLSSVYLLIYASAIFSESTQMAAALSRFPYKVFLLQHGVFFAIGILLSKWNRGNIFLVCAICLFFLMGTLEVWIKSVWIDVSVMGALLIWFFSMCFLLLSIAVPINWKFSRAIKFLGNLSYPVYLNHYSLGMVSVFLLHRAGYDGVLLFIASTFVVLVASVSVLVIESFVRGKLSKRRNRVKVPLGNKPCEI